MKGDKKIPRHMDVIVNDGTKIHLLRKGQGTPLLLLAGGGFSSTIFKNQIEFFSRNYEVIAIDMRSCGLSERVTYGMRISRFAKDFYDITQSLGLEYYHVLAHSLGCSVFYSYLDLFNPSVRGKAILVDQPPVLTANPFWSQEERLRYGATYDAAKNYELLNEMRTNFPALKKKIVTSMTTKSASNEIHSFIESCLDISPEAATLLYGNHFAIDWRDLVRRVSFPTLIIGGRLSLTPWQSQQYLREQIPHSELKIFEEEEGGSHFMFVENPTRFNQVVSDFLLT